MPLAKTVLLSLGGVGALAAAEQSEYVVVPGGRFVHSSCVHEVPSHTHFEDDGENFIFTFPNGTRVSKPQCNHHVTPLSVTHGGAWKAWAQFKLDGSSSVTSLSNSWIVPENPTSEGGQILYYWNGVEDGSTSGGTGVLQPVLQWTSGGWGIKSWYVGAGGTVTSDLVSTPTGSKVLGSMVHQDGTWTVTGTAEDGTSAVLRYTRQTLTFTYAYEVLEAYTVGSSCSMYPPQAEGVTFTDTKIAFDGKDATDSIQWVPYSCPSGPGCSGSAECGERATVSGNDVTISYRTSSFV